MPTMQEQLSAGPGGAPNQLILLMTGARVASHDSVAPLANSYGYYLHDDVLS